MYHLILDIKEYIGSFDRKAWVRLTIYDEEFKSFAYCLDVGSFGNIDLPTLDGLTSYEYI